MPIDTKWFTSDMRGAPQLPGNAPGSYTTLLRTLLLPTGGFGLTTALSVTVAGGIATVSVQAGMTFLSHSVVLVAGATGSYAPLNGENRVLTSSNTAITFATAAPDGTATGTITVKYAPVGQWEEVYSKTNVAVFRSTHPLSRGHCIRVDDTNGLAARVVGYASMTDVDTGTGAFPSTAQMSGGEYWHKRGAADGTGAKWKFFGDGLMFFTAVAPYSDTPTSLSAPLRGFGYPIALSPSGDDHLCILSGASNTTTVNGALDGGLYSGQGRISAARSYTGLGGSVLMDSVAYTGATGAVSGTDATLGAVPSKIDGKLKFSRRYLIERVVGSDERGVVPGLLTIPQSGAYSQLGDGAIEDGSGELSGRKLMSVATNTNLSGTPAGLYYMDITGPWRAP